MNSWADIVAQECLDDSRDGLNLMIKSTLSVGQKNNEKNGINNEKANALLRGHNASRSLLGSRRTTVPSKDAIPSITSPVSFVTDGQKESPWKTALMKKAPPQLPKKQETIKEEDEKNEEMDVDDNSNFSSMPVSETSIGFKRSAAEMKSTEQEEEPVSNEQEKKLTFAEKVAMGKSATVSNTRKEQIEEKKASDKLSEAEKKHLETIKRRKKNDKPIDIRVKELQTSVISSPLLVIKRVKNWASDSEDDSDDENEQDQIQEPKIATKKSDVDTEVNKGGDIEVDKSDRSSTPVPCSSHDNHTPVPGMCAGVHQPIEDLTPARIDKRQRQIDIGKSTTGYKNYMNAVPIEKRLANNYKHPFTPDKKEGVSKRQWDTKVRRWRRTLHEWDEPATATTNVRQRPAFMTRRNPRKSKTPKLKGTPAFLKKPVVKPQCNVSFESKKDFPSLN